MQYQYEYEEDITQTSVQPDEITSGPDQVPSGFLQLEAILEEGKGVLSSLESRNKK